MQATLKSDFHAIEIFIHLVLVFTLRSFEIQCSLSTSNMSADDVLDDIEDIVGEGDLTALERSVARSNAVGKRVKKTPNNKDPAKSNKVIPKVEENGSIIPGTQKIWVKTWGE